MNRFNPLNVLVVLFVLLYFSSCKNSDSSAQMPMFKIPVVDVINQDVPLYSEFIGQTYGRKDIPIRARVDGFLQGVYFEEGSQVKKGQLLYRIEPQSLSADLAAANSRVAEAQTNLSKAKNDLERIRPLAKINAVSKSELDNAVAKYEAAKAQLKSAQANRDITSISLSYSELRSPIDGIIGFTAAKEGEYVGREPNPVILNTVSQIDSIVVKFFLTESEYLSLARAFRGNDKDSADSDKPNREGLELLLSDGSVFDKKGFTESIDNKVDPNTGAITTQAVFPNPDKLLRPGLFARIRAQVGLEKDALLVPQRAILFIQGKPSVLTVSAENEVNYQEVSLGEKYKNLWVVKEGLKKGDKVVLEGGQKLRSGVKIEPVKSEFKITQE